MKIYCWIIGMLCGCFFAIIFPGWVTNLYGLHDSHEGSLRLPEPQYHLSEILEEKTVFPHLCPSPPVTPEFSYSQLYQICDTTWRPSLSALPSMHESILLPWHTPHQTSYLRSSSDLHLRPSDCFRKPLYVEVPQITDREQSIPNRSWQKEGKEKELCDRKKHHYNFSSCDVFLYLYWNFLWFEGICAKYFRLQINLQNTAENPWFWYKSSTEQCLHGLVDVSDHSCAGGHGKYKHHEKSLQIQKLICHYFELINRYEWFQNSSPNQIQIHFRMQYICHPRSKVPWNIASVFCV